MNKKSTFAGGSLLLMSALLVLSGCNGELSPTVPTSQSTSSASSSTSVISTPSTPASKTVKVTFLDAKDKIIYEKEVNRGSSIKYEGFSPVKDAWMDNDPDAGYFYSYDFKGWDKSLENLQADTVFRPVFEENRFYTSNFGYYPKSIVTDQNIIDDVVEIYNNTHKHDIEYYQNHYRVITNGKAYTNNGVSVAAGTQVYLYESIDWKILSIDGKKITVISEDFISALRWNTYGEDDGDPATYLGSGLHEFINYDFVEMAFPNDWRIASSYVDNSSKQYLYTQDNYNGTSYDKVKILSQVEFKDHIKKESSEAEVEATDFTLGVGAQAIVASNGKNTTKTLLRNFVSGEHKSVVYNPSTKSYEKVDQNEMCGFRPIMTFVLDSFKYGEYPQSVVMDEDIIKELDKISEVDELGYIHYDGEKYYKHKSTKSYSAEDDYEYFINKGDEKYYLVEPIEWVAVNNAVNNGNYITLRAEKQLDFLPRFTKEEKDKLPMEDDYRYDCSYAHEWLNSEFYERAFHEENSRLMETRFLYDDFWGEFGHGELDMTGEEPFEVGAKTAALGYVGLPAASDLTDMFTEYTTTEPNDYAISRGVSRGNSHIYTRTLGEVGNHEVMLFGEQTSVYAYENLDINGGTILPSIRLSFYDAEVEYGEYAQKLVYDQETIDALDAISEVDAQGYKHLNGKKYLESVCETSPMGMECFADDRLSVYATTDESNEGVPYVHNLGDVLYFEVTPIKWRVLEQKGDSIKVVSKKVLYAHVYDYDHAGYYWSNLREDLNDDFMKLAFVNDSSKLMKMTVDNSLESALAEESRYLGTDTEDYVTSLSLKELTSKAYFDNEFDYAALTTEYARSVDVPFYGNESAYDEGDSGIMNYNYAEYWLRSPADRSEYPEAYFVHMSSGYEICDVTEELVGIRPVIQLAI